MSSEEEEKSLTYIDENISITESIKNNPEKLGKRMVIDIGPDSKYLTTKNLDNDITSSHLKITNLDQILELINALSKNLGNKIDILVRIPFITPSRILADLCIAKTIPLISSLKVITIEHLNHDRIIKKEEYFREAMLEIQLI